MIIRIHSHTEKSFNHFFYKIANRRKEGKMINMKMFFLNITNKIGFSTGFMGHWSMRMKK